MALNKVEYPEKHFVDEVRTPEKFYDASGRVIDAPTMVSLNEAKSITGLSYEALRKMCINGEIVHIRIGAKYLINLEKLLAKLNGEA